MWEMTNGHVIKRLEPHNDLDMATPWAELACDDQVVVGLTVDENSRDIMPAAYKYQVYIIWYLPVVCCTVAETYYNPHSTATMNNT